MERRRMSSALDALIRKRATSLLVSYGMIVIVGRLTSGATDIDAATIVKGGFVGMLVGESVGSVTVLGKLVGLNIGVGVSSPMGKLPVGRDEKIGSGVLPTSVVLAVGSGLNTGNGVEPTSVVVLVVGSELNTGNGAPG